MIFTFIYCNSVKPGCKLRFEPEMFKIFINCNKYFLRNVIYRTAVADCLKDNISNFFLMLFYQQLEYGTIAVNKSFYKRKIIV